MLLLVVVVVLWILFLREIEKRRQVFSDWTVDDDNDDDDDYDSAELPLSLPLPIADTIVSVTPVHLPLAVNSVPFAFTELVLGNKRKQHHKALKSYTLKKRKTGSENNNNNNNLGRNKKTAGQLEEVWFTQPRRPTRTIASTLERAISLVPPPFSPVLSVTEHMPRTSLLRITLFNARQQVATTTSMATSVKETVMKQTGAATPISPLARPLYISEIVEPLAILDGEERKTPMLISTSFCESLLQKRSDKCKPGGDLIKSLETTHRDPFYPLFEDNNVEVLSAQAAAAAAAAAETELDADLPDWILVVDLKGADSVFTYADMQLLIAERIAVHIEEQVVAGSTKTLLNSGSGKQLLVTQELCKIIEEKQKLDPHVFIRPYSNIPLHLILRTITEATEESPEPHCSISMQCQYSEDGKFQVIVSLYSSIATQSVLQPLDVLNLILVARNLLITHLVFQRRSTIGIVTACTTKLQLSSKPNDVHNTASSTKTFIDQWFLPARWWRTPNTSKATSKPNMAILLRTLHARIESSVDMAKHFYYVYSLKSRSATRTSPTLQRVMQKYQFHIYLEDAETPAPDICTVSTSLEKSALVYRQATDTQSKHVLECHFKTNLSYDMVLLNLLITEQLQQQQQQSK